jgi:hypothetical protein
MAMGTVSKDQQRKKTKKFKQKTRKKILAGTEGMFMRMSTRLKFKKKNYIMLVDKVNLQRGGGYT